MIKIIKFRGKTKQCDKWVFGSLLDWAGSCQIWEKDNDGSTHNYIIYPETIGQFTGKLDEYKKEIYTGDIISDRPSGKYLCEVIFDFDLLAYATKNLKTGKISYLSEFTYAYIVGNIHKKSE